VPPARRIGQQKIEAVIRPDATETEDGDTIAIDLREDEVVLQRKERAQPAEDAEAVPAA
jgi:hypothetical protein